MEGGKGKGMSATVPRLASVLVVLALCCLAAPQTGHKKPATAKALKGKLGSIKRRKQQVQQALRQTRVAAKNVQVDLHAVNVRLNDVQGNLVATHKELGGAKQEQAGAATELRKATTEFRKVREVARLRLRAISKEGGSNVLVAFVTSRSVGDLAERQDLLRRIARKDHALFARVKALQAEVADRKRRQDGLVVRVAALARRQTAQRAELADVRAQKARALVRLRQREDQLETSLKQFEADAREISRLIAVASRRPRLGRRTLPAFIGRFLRPVGAPLTSGFGMRFHPILHRSRLHAGVDFGASTGTPIRCAAPGEVIAATRMGGFGNVVIVDHGGGVTTVYGHMSRIAVRGGQRVRQGQTLGAVGATGLATGPHLHWEVRIHGRPVNPMGRF